MTRRSKIEYWDIGFVGCGNTFCNAQRDKKKRKIINAECVDISKTFIHSCFSEIFGYPLNIDPCSFTGKGVVKSEYNYRHDGRIINCPIDNRKAGLSYSRFVNNVSTPGLTEDFRVPVVGSSIPFIFIRYRPESLRFTDHDKFVVVSDTSSIFSKSEIRLIILFCKKIKMDFGELDILRDQDDGKLYIVDANRTPASPPRRLSFWEGHSCMKMLSQAFDEEFIKPVSIYRTNDRILDTPDPRYFFRRVSRWIHAIALAIYRGMPKINFKIGNEQ